MLVALLCRWWNEPAAPDPPYWSRWDLLIVPLLLAAGVADPIANDVAWPVAIPLVAVAVTLILPWRFQQPLTVVILASVLIGGLHAAMLIADVEGPMTGALALLLAVYALVRRASARQITIGVAAALTGVLVAGSTQDASAGEALFGLGFWVSPILLGGWMRSRANLRDERLSEARLGERHRLARELHDSVAHHVSAIVIQAQAGRAVAAGNPDAALDALAVIEESASRTLGEMRGMVGALRGDDEATLAPQRGIVDIERLARDEGPAPRVEVELSGDLEGLGPTLEAGLFRMAQEAITNARRHARRASRVVVQIIGSADDVQLTVTDNGVPLGPGTREGGYGLVGMAERAAALGGHFDAGPRADAGWRVNAVLPRPRTSR